MAGGSVSAVCVGGSTGAVDALGELLPALPAEFAPALVVVVHWPPDAPGSLPALFAHRVAIPVREAADKEPVAPGAVWFAPPGYHLLVEAGGTFALSLDAPVRFSRPSIDVLFGSAAAAWGPRAVGIVLTGANEDGAAGLAALRAAGGMTIVQEPASAAARAMPDAAIALAKPQVVATLRDIARYLRTLTAR